LTNKHKKCYAGYEAQDKTGALKDISGMSTGLKLTF